ncbi:tetratricopeptide repeat protein [Nonomuraea endophytica]|uniref:tetratricopeptide repeat protein n=1 Tax=Nonomuraea endophytica TaxID=714136 RepID=UPI0037C73962
MGKDETGDDPDRSPREWCALSAARLRDGRPESALEAAQKAAGLDPDAEWAHRLISLAEERLGRDAESLAHAEHAVRLAPGSWQARLRLSAAQRHAPGGWERAVRQAELARAFAPEELTPHLQLGDLALIRGEHRRARIAYAAALERDIAHPQTRVNLGLAWLRWDSPRAHHDPAWPLDPRESGRARRALEVWSRQTRLLLAVATLAIAFAALSLDLGPQARLGGAAVLVAVAVLTVRQARRIGVWAYVPAMFGRAPWLGTSVVSALVAVAAFAAWLVLPAFTSAFDPVWAGLTGILVLGWPALAVLHALGGVWRGRPLRALEEFALARGEREGRRDTGVVLWIVLGRVWSVLVPLVLGALVLEPRAAVVALAVPYPLMEAYRKARHGEDRWLLAAALLVVVAAPACAAGGVFALAWAWWAGLGALGAVVALFALRGARAWWRGAPGPWRASLIMCEPLLGDAPSVALSPEVRQAFAYARSVVLSYADPAGPRVVGAVASVTRAGELRLIAEPQAWTAVEADPRVAVFAADPLQRRFWVEVRGIALADSDVLRVTPSHVLVGEFPGRHQRR